MSGLCAAVAAARNGASVVLMQDRPVLGGNGSSEVRVGLLGAYGHWDFSRRETGVVEEVDLESLYLNPGRNWEVRAADGSWTEAARITENHQRLARVPLAVETDAIRLVIDETWGAEQTRVFGFEVK